MPSRKIRDRWGFSRATWLGMIRTMSSLSSASTDEEVWQAYDDAASFEEDSSPAKAAAFITACRILLRRRPQMTNVDGTQVAFEPGVISRELDRARNWLSANRAASGSGVRHLDFSGLRD